MAGIPHDHYEPKSGWRKVGALALPIVGCSMTQSCSHAQEPELDVDLGHRSDVLPGVADCHRHRPCDALHAARRSWRLPLLNTSCAT